MTNRLLIARAVLMTAGTAIAQQHPGSINGAALHATEFHDGDMSVSSLTELPAEIMRDDEHGGAKVMAVWMVDKTKPLATPAL